MSDNTITIELLNNGSWDKITLNDGSTIQTLLNHGESRDGGFIPESSRFLVGENVVDRNHQLSNEDQVSFSQPNKVGG